MKMSSIISLTQRVWLAPILAVALGVTGCSSTPSSSESKESVSIIGAGASFPAPLYQKWFAEYNKIHPHVQISYQSIGSGAGIQQFTQEIVDFGASDVAMKDREIAKIKKGVVLLPMTAGSVVLAYNLPGIEQIKLSRQAIVDIFLGKIEKWNDPALAKINPGVNLPDTEISVIRRSDASGTTAVFTNYLSAVSPEWKQQVGNAKTVEWPTGIGTKGNEGASAQIKLTEGAIGYIEYSYAKRQNISMASLENKAGNFIAPSSQSAANTLRAVKLPENLRAFITDPEGENSYPIVTYTWILAYKQYQDPAKEKVLKQVIAWALEDGQKISEELGYIPLPKDVASRVEQALDQIQ